ncbi:universal stress protein [Pandoraea sputorum]|uniref:universal stress protein n=1 Tax=Pandoraea sputorum TaxID=93222 RepID=UPI002F3E504C
MNGPTSLKSPPHLPARVFVAIDPYGDARHAIAVARRVIAPSGAVRLVSVAENPLTHVPVGSLVGEALNAARAELSEKAHEAVAAAAGAFAERDVHVETHTIDLSQHGGDVVHALVDDALAWHAELVVLGTHQHHGLSRWIEGVVSEPVARLANCPVLVVPEISSEKVSHSLNRLLFAIDGSEQATQAMRFGLRFATSVTHVRALYVVDCAVRLSDLVPVDFLENEFVEEGTRALEAAKLTLAQTSSRSSTALIRTDRTRDDIAHAIVREAQRWHADLIVMGTHGRRGIVRWMLGTVAGRVAQIARTPVLLVRGSHG